MSREFYGTPSAERVAWLEEQAKRLQRQAARIEATLTRLDHLLAETKAAADGGVDLR